VADVPGDAGSVRALVFTGLTSVTSGLAFRAAAGLISVASGSAFAAADRPQREQNRSSGASGL